MKTVRSVLSEQMPNRLRNISRPLRKKLDAASRGKFLAVIIKRNQDLAKMDPELKAIILYRLGSFLANSP